MGICGRSPQKPDIYRQFAALKRFSPQVCCRVRPPFPLPLLPPKKLFGSARHSMYYYTSPTVGLLDNFLTIRTESTRYSNVTQPFATNARRCVSLENSLNKVSRQLKDKRACNTSTDRCHGAWFIQCLREADMFTECNAPAFIGKRRRQLVRWITCCLTRFSAPPQCLEQNLVIICPRSSSSTWWQLTRPRRGRRRRYVYQ